MNTLNYFENINQAKVNLCVDKAIVFDRNEFFMWKLNDRIAELKEKDRDSNVWGGMGQCLTYSLECVRSMATSK